MISNDLIVDIIFSCGTVCFKGVLFTLIKRIQWQLNIVSNYFERYGLNTNNKRHPQSTNTLNYTFSIYHLKYKEYKKYTSYDARGYCSHDHEMSLLSNYKNNEKKKTKITKTTKTTTKKADREAYGRKKIAFTFSH